MLYGFIGTGNMGGALARSCAKAVKPENLFLSNRTPEKAQALAKELGAQAVDNETIAARCDVLFLGVKPQGMENMLRRLRPVLDGRTTPFVLVSMAAGLTVAALQRMADLQPDGVTGKQTWRFLTALYRSATRTAPAPRL